MAGGDVINEAVAEAEGCLKSMNPDTRTYLLVIIALLCPPLAVFLSRDAFETRYFWLNLLLTLLAWFPGVLHALWVILVVKDRPAEGYEPLV